MKGDKLPKMENMTMTYLVLFLLSSFATLFFSFSFFLFLRRKENYITSQNLMDKNMKGNNEPFKPPHQHPY